jgi:DNA-directed RNA polymerase subunit M/transcription elongation factor TFIIS
MKTVAIPSGEPSGRITCNRCGNASQFVEMANNVLVTTHYVQNRDGSFTQEESETEVLGEVRLLCGQCGADLSQYHSHFMEMTF